MQGNSERSGWGGPYHANENTGAGGPTNQPPLEKVGILLRELVDDQGVQVVHVLLNFRREGVLFNVARGVPDRAQPKPALVNVHILEGLGHRREHVHSVGKHLAEREGGLDEFPLLLEHCGVLCGHILGRNNVGREELEAKVGPAIKVDPINPEPLLLTEQSKLTKRKRINSAIRSKDDIKRILHRG